MNVVTKSIHFNETKLNLKEIKLLKKDPSYIRIWLFHYFIKTSIKQLSIGMCQINFYDNFIDTLKKAQ